MTTKTYFIHTENTVFWMNTFVFIALYMIIERRTNPLNVKCHLVLHSHWTQNVKSTVNQLDSTFRRQINADLMLISHCVPAGIIHKSRLIGAIYPTSAYFLSCMFLSTSINLAQSCLYLVTSTE